MGRSGSVRNRRGQQQGTSRSGVGTRATWARIASLTGAVGLVSAPVVWLLTGDVTGLVVVCGLAAFLGFAVWTLLAPQDFRALLTGRQTVYGTNSLLISALFAGAVAIVYSLAVGSGVAVDLSSTGFYSLKPDVRPIVQELSRPIQITGFYNRLLLGAEQADSPVLQMFRDANPDMVQIVTYDPDVSPLVARQFGHSGSFGLYVSYLNEDGTPDLRASGTVQVVGEVANERTLAEAILQLEARGQYRVVFPVGNGELSLDTDATGIRDGLVNAGIEVVAIDLENNELPEDTTALVILGPRRDYGPAAVERIRRYLGNGGDVLLMAEPAYEGSITFMVPTDSPLAEYLSDEWGVTPERDFVFDPASFVNNTYYVQPGRYLESHPIVVKDDSGTPAQPLFTIVQSWAIAEVPNVAQNVIYATTDQAFGKTNLAEVARNPDRVTRDTSDIPGPLNLVVAAENVVSGARLLVVGDADWVSNDLIVAYDGQILWTNMIDWLTNYVERITVDPIMIAAPLNVSQVDLNVVALVTVLLLPGLVLLTGGVVWWRRSRR